MFLDALDEHSPCSISSPLEMPVRMPQLRHLSSPGAALLLIALLLAGVSAPTPAHGAPGASGRPTLSAERIWALVDAYARRYGIPLQIARNLVRVESGGRQDAVSPSGARGVMQLMPATARALGIDIDDPEQNIEGGMRYLRRQYDRFGRWDLALAAYHSGPAAVLKHNGIPPTSQTFVRRVLSGTTVAAARGPSSTGTTSGNGLPPGFAWPLSGPLTARFTGRHRGVDVAAPIGTPIRASRAGRVRHAGRYYEYGLTVILDHGGGVSTLYGHASAVLVRVGQAVAAGEVIARVGCTGRCTGPHVHFEIRINGAAVDPLRQLPRRAEAPRPPGPAPVEGPMGGPAGPAIEAVPLPTLGAAVDYTTTVRDTVQGGQMVGRREEIVVSLEGGMRVRIIREYRLIDGALVMVSEHSEVYRDTEIGRNDP